MSHDRSGRYDYMDIDDFEKLPADRPSDERWELIGGASAGRRTIEGLPSALNLPAVNASVPLSEIYGDVVSA